MCAKHYENPTMLSGVTAKNVGDVFLRHTVESLNGTNMDISEKLEILLNVCEILLFVA